MRKTNENKQTNGSHNSKSKNCGGKGCGKNAKDCK